MSKRINNGEIVATSRGPNYSYVDITIRIPLESDEPNVIQSEIYDWKLTEKVRVKEL